MPAALLLSALVQFAWSVVRWPFDRLLDLLSAFLNSSAFGPVMVVVALVVTAGIFVLYRLGLRAIVVAQAEVAPPKTDVPVTADDALAAAERCEGIGQHREACHYALLAALLAVEEKGLARFSRSATNREHLAQLAVVTGSADGPVLRAISPAIDRFDRLWYGQTSVSERDYADLVALVGRVREALG
jgi:hypothetical protein